MGEAKDQPAVFRYIAAGKVTPGPKFDAVDAVSDVFFPFFPGNFIHQVVENLAKKMRFVRFCEIGKSARLQRARCIVPCCCRLSSFPSIWQDVKHLLNKVSRQRLSMVPRTMLIAILAYYTLLYHYPNFQRISEIRMFWTPSLQAVLPWEKWRLGIYFRYRDVWASSMTGSVWKP